MTLHQRFLYVASGMLIALSLQCGNGGGLTAAVAAEPLRATATGKYAVSTAAVKGSYNSDADIYVTIIDTETGQIFLQRRFDKGDYEHPSRRW